MLNRIFTAGLALLLISANMSCSQSQPTDVLATVDGDPVTLDELPTAPLSEAAAVQVSNGLRQGAAPRRALDRVIRDELLLREAERRGFTGSRSALLGALVADERQQHPQLVAETITDSEARNWYETTRATFEHLETAHIYWAEFASEAAAQEVFDAGISVNESDFARIVTQAEAADLVDHGTETVVLDDAEVNAMLLRIANAVREAGHVGMDQDRVLGNWWVVRVENVTLGTQPWDSELALKVKTALAWEREQQHLDEMAAGLRDDWPVDVNEDLVEQLIGNGEL
jgi:hypothetical protein